MEKKHSFSQHRVGSNAFSGQFYQNHSLSTSSSCSVSSSSSQDNSPTSDQPPLSPAISDTDSVSSGTECKICLRQAAPLFCFSCGFWMANGRIRKPCTSHPRVFFYTDFTTCPKCKKAGQLRELD